MTPVEVAAALRHLPGLVFFDTAGNLPSSAGQPVSVIAARPAQLLKGSIHQVGAHLQGAPSCNGWSFWHLNVDGKLVSSGELTFTILEVPEEGM